MTESKLRDDAQGKQIFSTEGFFGKYESKVREVSGKELDSLKELIHKIENRCTIRVMNIQFHNPTKYSPITVESLKSCKSDSRRKILSALLYNDALWRLEAAYLMMCIGVLNVAYANLRTSLEALLSAYIVERCDNEALSLLGNGRVNQKLAEDFITNSEYSDLLRAMKKAFSDWGVHTNFQSLQISSLFGANRFEKFVAESKLKVKKEPQLFQGSIDAIGICIKHGTQVGILFSWLESIPVKRKDE